jgi:hypothetical protein
MYRMWMCTCRRNAAEARGMRRCASLYSETTPSVSVDRCGVCGEAWWRAPERAWLPPCHTPVGCGVPACEVDSTLHTRMRTAYVEPSCPERCFVTVLYRAIDTCVLRLGARVRVPRGVRTTFPRPGAHALVALRRVISAVVGATRLGRGDSPLHDTILI